MQSLFKKFFSNNENKNSGEGESRPADPVAQPAPAAQPERKVETKMDEPKQRKVIYAPVIGASDDNGQTDSEGIRIKAKADRQNPENCVFMLDRPVFRGYSAWFPDADSAADAPLAAELFKIDGVENILYHDTTITVGRDPSIYEDWKPKAQEIGAKIRGSIKNGIPFLDQPYIDRIPSEDLIRDGIQAVLDDEINPGIAAHSGVITLLDVTGNTVKINMGGGCQGCAASTITLKQGIHAAFRAAVPEVGAIIDDTNHEAGENPYFKELPEGMMN